MSTPTDLVAKARRQTGSNSTSYTSDDAILDLNNRLSILYSRIQKEIDEGWFWTYATFDTISGQSEYTIDTIWTAKVNELDWVSIKYNSTDTTYKKLRRKSYDVLDYDMQAYSNWAWEPFYFVKDRSFFIFPSTTSSVTAGWKIFSILQPADVTISSAESDIKIDPRFHQYIVWGMCADYWHTQLRDDKAEYWEQKFTLGGDSLIKALKNREQETLEHEVSLNPYE